MESRVLKINFNKSGRGTKTPKIALPISMITDMGITEENREIKLFYDSEKKQIILQKN